MYVLGCVSCCVYQPGTCRSIFWVYVGPYTGYMKAYVLDICPYAGHILVHNILAICPDTGYMLVHILAIYVHILGIYRSIYWV